MLERPLDLIQWKHLWQFWKLVPRPPSGQGIHCNGLQLRQRSLQTSSKRILQSRIVFYSWLLIIHIHFIKFRKKEIWSLQRKKPYTVVQSPQFPVFLGQCRVSGSTKARRFRWNVYHSRWVCGGTALPHSANRDRALARKGEVVKWLVKYCAHL